MNVRNGSSYLLLLTKCVADVIDSSAVFVLEHNMPWCAAGGSGWQWKDFVLSRVGQSCELSEWPL